jgi:hypothetical protein
MEDLKSVLTIAENQMDEWREICEAFAKKVGAKLVFVNETGCGLEYPDGTYCHTSIEGMQRFLEKGN